MPRQSRFGVAYAVCGCPSESEQKSDMPRGRSRTLRRIKSHIPSALRGTPENPRPDLVTDAKSDTNATHPSDHNAVVSTGAGGTITSNQIWKQERQLQDRSRKVERGLADDWTILQHQRKLRTNHNLAFSDTTNKTKSLGGFGIKGAACGAANGAAVTIPSTVRVYCMCYLMSRLRDERYYADQLCYPRRCMCSGRRWSPLWVERSSLRPTSSESTNACSNSYLAVAFDIWAQWGVARLLGRVRSDR
jgi:hypothetical protein